MCNVFFFFFYISSRMENWTPTSSRLYYAHASTPEAESFCRSPKAVR